MTLLKKLEECIALGYSVLFIPKPMNVEIKIKKYGNDGSVFEQISWLPTSDHFYEERIVSCIDWSVSEIKKQNEKK